MSKFFGSIALVGVCLLVFGDADAGDAGAKKRGKRGGGLLGKGNTEEMFNKLDADKNGKLTKEEYLKDADKISDADKAEKAKQFLGKMFDRIAVDDAVTMEQLKKAGEKLGQKRKKKKTDA